MAYIYDLTDTWNAGATTFNGIKLNVTDTASAATSKLITLQTTGTEHFSVTKAGVGYFSSNVGIGTSSPSTKLQVSQTGGNFFVGAAFAKVENTSGTSATLFLSDTTDSASIKNIGSALAFIGSSTERMRIDSSGNVGVGTSSPNYKLDANGIIASYRPSAGQAGYWTYNGGATVEWFTGQKSGTDHAYKISSVVAGTYTDRVTIDTSGNLLVGTTAAGLSNTTSLVLDSGNGWSIGNHSGTASGTAYAFFGYNGTSIGTITQNGTTGVLYNTSSDVRLKHDIIDAPEASSLIDAIQVRSFKWNADNSEQRYGFIAQELVTVAPEAVSQPADPDAMMGVDYSKLVPMLVKELQSVRARLAQLEGAA